MDVNTLRVLVTLLSLAAFVGIVIWAWLRRNQTAFAQAARLPLLDDAQPPSASNERSSR
jgi:cytochrome c oxidase cbb3-type subunit IV